jgi:hypothetical protein
MDGVFNELVDSNQQKCKPKIFIRRTKHIQLTINSYQLTVFNARLVVKQVVKLQIIIIFDFCLMITVY